MGTAEANLAASGLVLVGFPDLSAPASLFLLLPLVRGLPVLVPATLSPKEATTAKASCPERLSTGTSHLRTQYCRLRTSDGLVFDKFFSLAHGASHNVKNSCYEQNKHMKKCLKHGNKTPVSHRYEDECSGCAHEEKQAVARAKRAQAESSSPSKKGGNKGKGKKSI